MVILYTYTLIAYRRCQHYYITISLATKLSNEVQIDKERRVHFIPIVGVGKRGAYSLVHGDLPRQHCSELP